MGLRTWIYKKTGIRLKKVKLKVPETFTEIALKKHNLNRTKIINTIVLGSSHGAYSLDVNLIKNAFNLCSTSQDLYCSLQLYNQVTFNHSELKNVILFFSAFSFGFDISKTKDKSIAAYFKYIFNVHPQYNEIEIDLIANECHNYKVKKTKIAGGFKPLNNFFPPAHATINRVNTHLKRNDIGISQMGFLSKISNECKKNNHQLIIVISPARDDYKSLIPSRYFDEIYKLKEHYSFNLIDLFDSNIFTDDDFGDCDHVNINGANKLTYEVMKLI